MEKVADNCHKFDGKPERVYYANYVDDILLPLEQAALSDAVAAVSHLEKDALKFGTDGTAQWEREDVLRLLEKIVRLENQDSPYLRGELKRLKGVALVDGVAHLEIGHLPQVARVGCSPAA